MSEITIYGVPQSTYVRTVRMAAEEKGVAYEIVPATPDSADITSLHPFAKMPAVRHGDHVFWETPAITDYIDRAFDGPALMPADPAARALALSWISAVEDYIYPVAIRRYVLQYIFPKGADGQPDRAVIDPAVEEIKGHLQRIDDQLAKTAWIGGDDFTLADCFLAPIMFYVSQMPEGGEMLGAHANIQRTGGMMHERASYMNTKPPMPGEQAA